MFSFIAGISSFSEADDNQLINTSYSSVKQQKAIVLNNDSININKKNDKTDKCTLFLMSMIVITGPLSTESQVPALQNIKTDFHTTSNLVQLSITIYMLFYGGSQLIFGTVSDIFGRKRVLICGLFIYCITSVGCSLSPSIYILIICRAIQAIGAGIGNVIIYAVVRDLFHDSKQRVFYFSIISGVKPIIIASSPIFGGIITHFFGWRFIYYIIAGIALILLIISAMFFPETNKEICSYNNNRRSTLHFKVKEYCQTMKVLISDKIFVGLIVITGIIYCGIFIMFNELSFIMQIQYHFNVLQTGFYTGFIIGGLLIGSMLSILFTKITKLSPFKIIFIAIMVVFLCGIVLMIPFLDTISFINIIIISDLNSNYWWTIIPLFFYVMADGIMLPNLISIALEPYKDCAGCAASLAGFVRFFFGAVMALIATSVSNQHLQILHTGMSVMAALATIVYVIIVFIINCLQ